VNEERVSGSRNRSVTASRLSAEAHQHEFAEPLDTRDKLSGQVLFQIGRIIDEICFAKRDGDNSAPSNGHLESASDGFDFRKFWHKRED
jgi:hypothetical protein